jgi:4-amino-4-deoxy-L-arabinose transferase-like glycosyltransferase
VTPPTAPDLLDRIAAGARAYVLIALIGVVAALPGFFAIPPLDRDESRFAQATAQMLETGDFVRIAVQDDPRNKKPVGIHWLQAATVAAVSKVEAREIWAYRLPSMTGAVLAALATFWGGAVLVGRRSAFVAAALLAASILLSTEAMIAKTDAVLCGVTTLMMAALARLRMGDDDAQAKRLALLAWAALGLGILVKGPITLAVAALTMLVLWAWERRLERGATGRAQPGKSQGVQVPNFEQVPTFPAGSQRTLTALGWARPLATFAGPCLALLIVAPWFAAIQIATGGEFLREAVGHDLGTKISGGGEHPFTPPGFHLLLLPLLSFPITLGLVAGVRVALGAVRAPWTDGAAAPIRFLLAWAAPSFLMFEAAPTKLVHYPLPTYPAFALLAGAGLVAMLDRGWTRTRWASIGLSALVSAGLVATCAALTSVAADAPAHAAEQAAQAAIIGGAAASAWLVALAMSRRAMAWLALGLCAAIAFTWTARERIAPSMGSVLVSRAATQALHAVGLHPRLDAGAGRLWIVGYREPSLVFLTATDAILANGAQAGAEARASASMLVEARQRAALETALAARGLAFVPVGPPITGRNYSNGDQVSLQPGRALPAP